MAQESEDAAAPENMTTTAETILDYMLKGGPFLMIPLAALSFLAVILIIFYLFTIRQGAIVSDRFMNAADAAYLFFSFCSQGMQLVFRMLHHDIL